jgi:SAM-dependent methyltransferase
VRPSINKLVGIFAEGIPSAEPIYEFGAFQVAGQEAIADLRPYFPGKRYVGTDMREGRGVDRVLDLHDLDIETGTVGTAIMIDTLEHVEYPHRALEEVHRVLDDRGIVLMTSVMRFRIHEYPDDYWRFTPEAFRSLLKGFEFSWADFAGEPDFPHTVVGIGAKTDIEPAAFGRFLERYGRWKEWARAETWREWLTPHPPGVPPHPDDAPASRPPTTREQIRDALPDPVVRAIRRLKRPLGRASSTPAAGGRGGRHKGQARHISD